ncbi:FmdB family zinc ribbon protein [Halomonas halocynthiae]|uniref:FmdB family zinc ribbon protein n=1 Tax=Halomonas halocynthiae TaxID=176290 RepID=UPI00040556FE|nr:zinc ribbon domain-containing protein [Halomonas halocynthiae]
MPIYEYKCKACGHRLEKLQRLSAEPLRDCPACEQAELARLVSAAGFRLAGSGWYETDFKTGSKQNLASDSASGNATTPSTKDGASA